MKKYLYFIIVILNYTSIYSQIIAGSTSSGLIISNPAVNFSVTSIYGNQTKSFDLDCDSLADITVELYKGPTIIDGINYAFLHVINPTFKICADTLNSSFRQVHYFQIADTVIPPASSNWYNDSTLELGNYGCMECFGPFTVTNLFIGYKNTITSQIGWIKITFNLIDGGVASVPITMSIPEVLSPCTTTSVSSTSTSTPTYTSSGIATCGVFTYNYMIYTPSCPGNCDGGVLISSITGGTPVYYYQWSMGVVTSSVTNICAGAYMFNITDAAGNTCNANFLVQDPIPITFSLTTTNISCNGETDGSICHTAVMGGNPFYTFSWSPFGGNGTCINNLWAGTYTFCVTDANGCEVCKSATVNEPSPIQVSEFITQASCFFCCDGSSQLLISGGNVPYVTVYTNTPSCQGVYGYTVTDSKGCFYTDSVLISYPTSLTEHSSEKMFDVFPNPSKGNFEIKNLNQENSIYRVVVTDIYGKTMYSKVTQLLHSSLIVDLTLVNGIYFVQIIDESGINNFSKKIIIEK